MRLSLMAHQKYYRSHNPSAAEDRQRRIDEIQTEIDESDPLNHIRTIRTCWKLRTRSDQQRPYRIAWFDAMERLVDAEVQAATDRTRRDELDHKQGRDSHLAELESLLNRATPTVRAEYADALAELRTGPDNVGDRLGLHLAELAATSSASAAAEVSWRPRLHAKHWSNSPEALTNSSTTPTCS